MDYEYLEDDQHEGKAGNEPPTTVVSSQFSSARPPSPFSRFVKWLWGKSAYRNPDRIRTNFGWQKRVK